MPSSSIGTGSNNRCPGTAPLRNCSRNRSNHTRSCTALRSRITIPAEVSNSAGTYVCNHLMYGVLHFLAASGLGARAGFIHVPYSEEQVIDKPAIAAMSLATMVKGVEAAIVAASRHATDIKVEGGTLD